MNAKIGTNKLKKPLEREELLDILKKYDLSPNIIDHSIMVTEKALEIANKIKNNGHKVDLELILAGALLHDIGRSKKHGWKHAVEGGLIIREMQLDERIALIAERHILAGIKKEEASQFGLPEIDYIPETIEEKIVTYADKLTKGSNYISIDERFTIWQQKYGNTKILENAYERAKKLEKELLNLMEN
ncbi:MAG: TIGR00295 family protein [Candidatus Lokiarchaeota archaeon]|nr:TIGR00295 family protein [Candidatus Lokiarchaeota archaeon]